MIDDYQAWVVLLEHWRWWNFLMVLSGATMLLYSVCTIAIDIGAHSKVGDEFGKSLSDKLLAACVELYDGPLTFLKFVIMLMLFPIWGCIAIALLALPFMIYYWIWQGVKALAAFLF